MRPFLCGLALWLPGLAAAGEITVGPSGNYPTISQAIAAATWNDTIRIEPGTYDESLWIDRNLTLEGISAGVVIGPGGSSPVVSVASYVDATLKDLTVDGGGVHRNVDVGSEATVDLEDLVFVGGSDSYTSGVYAWGGAEVNLLRCSLEDEVPSAHLYAQGDGTVLSATDTTVRNMVSTGWDSAVSVDNGATVVLTNVLVADNLSAQASGGIDAYGSGTRLEIYDSEIRDNEGLYSAFLDFQDASVAVLERNTITGDPSAQSPQVHFSAGSSTASVTLTSNRLYDVWLDLYDVDTSSVIGNLACGSQVNASGGGTLLAANNLFFPRAGSHQFVQPSLSAWELDSATILHNDFLGPDVATAMATSGSETDVVFMNNLVAHFAIGMPSVQAVYEWPDKNKIGLTSNAWYDNTRDSNGVDLGGNLWDVDPLLTDYSADGDCDNDNPVLLVTSPLIDAGDDTYGLDPDGSPPDIGATGGPYLTWVTGRLDDDDEDGWVNRLDCDEEDADIHPEADPICDGVTDADCDGTPDGGETYYPDEDDDGYGAEGSPTTLCGSMDGFVADPADDAFDCDDDDPDVHPDAPELCDDVDQNCDEDPLDGLVLSNWYFDGDEDGFGDAAEGIEACGEEVEGRVLDATDCDDARDDVHPGGIEICDGVDQDCDDKTDEGTRSTFWPDADDDGYGDPDGETTTACTAPQGHAPEATDCDDGSSDIHPDATETCDGIDEDCDSHLDEGLTRTSWFEDEDGDGYGTKDASVLACAAPKDHVADDSDCDDDNDTLYPNAIEVCGDGYDQDCDGSDSLCPADDGDEDGYCDGPSCSDASLPGDCDDDNDAVFPGQTEACNAIDDDCDAVVDEGLSIDEDGDDSSAPGSCEGGADDCNDDIESIHPGAQELCNGIDDDCDLGVDEGLSEDLDEDGYPSLTSCLRGQEGDCDDGSASVHPDALENPTNGVDDDCDGDLDEPSGLANTDDDGDGYCESEDGCIDGSTPGDCDDQDPQRSHGTREVANGVDDDCDGTVDDLDSTDGDGDGFSPADGDCNDFDAEQFPEAPERCNGLDDSCDGVLPAAEWDLDRDQVRTCEGDCDDNDPRERPYLAEDCSDGLDNDCDGTVDLDADSDGDGVTTCSGDCRDTDDSVHPGAEDTCNGIDDDCDLAVDEGSDLDGDGIQSCNSCILADCDCDDLNALVRPGIQELCGDGADNDCDGTVDVATDGDLDGWDSCNGDCDDRRPDISAGSPEICDAIDNDCDDAIDEGYDDDEDGLSTCVGDCVDTSPDVPAAEESCNAIDDDCDGTVDEGFPDGDEDGVLACAGDCDDANASVNPAATEMCADGLDNDCDGTTDPPELCVSGPPGCFCAGVGSGPKGMLLWAGLLALATLRRRTDRPAP